MPVIAISWTAADFNGDHRADLAVPLSGDNKISVLLTTSVIDLFPGSLAFNPQPVGSTSSRQNLMISNPAIDPLGIDSVAITGSNPGDFAETNTCGTMVASGTNCVVSVSFSPVSMGARTATLTLADTAPSSPQTVALSGTGTGGPGISFSPTSLTFPTTVVFTSSKQKNLILTNTGTSALTVASVTVTGDFTQINNCGASVAAGASCKITVVFKPTVSGTEMGNVEVTDNAPGSPQTVSLAGTGTVMKFSPASLNFGSHTVGTTSAPQTVTLTNVGATTLSITSIAIAGMDAADFARTTTCTPSLAAHASCSVSVTFTPTATGARSATVSVHDTGGGSPQTVPLSGTGT